MASPTRVLLADDHSLVRAGIRSLLDDMGDVEVVAETGDGHETLDLIEQLQPDVALLDITMPTLNGLEVAARVPKLSPQTRILVLSMHADEVTVALALRAGVAGYLLKDAAASELEVAVRAVARGDTYLSAAISLKVVDAYVRGEQPPIDPLSGLTGRKREVLQLVAEGKSSKQIASILGLSIKTVEAHRTQLMRQLDIHDIAGLARFAVRIGLIPPER
jgi:NarL family two-component system response regulator LiaR